MFRAGDLAFYPNQGIGRIEKVVSIQLDHAKQSFYVLRVLDRDITIKVPCDRAEELGLRTILPEDHVPKIFRILREKSKVRGYRTWNKRFREYSQKLRSGSPFEIAEVLRDLMLLQNSKDLSFGERKLLDQARALLIKELSFACESDENELVERVTKTVRTGQQKKSAGN